MIRHLVRLLVMTTFLAVPSTAHAADELELSRDGSTWGTTLGAPLFDPSFRWVPGETHVESFHVRNAGPTRGDLTVDVTVGRSDSLIATGDLRISARRAGGTWTSVTDGGTHRIVPASALADGAEVRIDVEIAFDPASTNASQLSDLRFAFDVRLVEAAGGPATGDDEDDEDDDSSTDPGDAGVLPDTGAPRAALLVVGLLLLLAGVALITRRLEDRS